MPIKNILDVWIYNFNAFFLVQRNRLLKLKQYESIRYLKNHSFLATSWRRVSFSSLRKVTKNNVLRSLEESSSYTETEPQDIRQDNNSHSLFAPHSSIVLKQFATMMNFHPIAFTWIHMQDCFYLFVFNCSVYIGHLLYLLFRSYWIKYNTFSVKVLLLIKW